MKILAFACLLAVVSFKMSDGSLCDVCDVAVHNLGSVLDSSASAEAVKKALKEVCNLLSSSAAKNDCLASVAKYDDDLASKLMTGEITREKVCKVLRLCSASKTKQLPFECSTGASYWCASTAHAARCNAVQYCKTHHGK